MGEQGCLFYMMPCCVEMLQCPKESMPLPTKPPPPAHTTLTSSSDLLQHDCAPHLAPVSCWFAHSLTQGVAKASQMVVLVLPPALCIPFSICT